MRHTGVFLSYTPPTLPFTIDTIPCHFSSQTPVNICILLICSESRMLHGHCEVLPTFIIVYSQSLLPLAALFSRIILSFHFASTNLSLCDFSGPLRLVLVTQTIRCSQKSSLNSITDCMMKTYSLHVILQYMIKILLR